MSKKIILIFAYHKEANSVLYQANINFNKTASDRYIASYRGKEVVLIISGIGKKAKKVNADMFDDYVSNIDLIIKAGTCAVIDHDSELLNPLIPSRLSYKNEFCSIDFSKINKNLSKIINKYKSDKILVTVDNILSSGEKADLLYDSGCSFADMETYFLYDNLKNYPFLPILIGTDRGDFKAKSDFFKTIKKAGELLKNVILEVLNEMQ
jgi:nucleoside phosphorylase